MTDNEIVKALEHIEAFTCCKDCAFYKKCTGKCVITETLNLINRQKAEIERLENKVKGFEKIRRAYQRFIYESMPNIQTALDKVLKELVGENDEKI